MSVPTCQESTATARAASPVEMLVPQQRAVNPRNLGNQAVRSVEELDWESMAGDPAISWDMLAACRFEDPEIFYPEKGGVKAAKAAKRVCADCIVRADCLKDSLDNKERFGIWGGLSEHERRKLLKSAR